MRIKVSSCYHLKLHLWLLETSGTREKSLNIYSRSGYSVGSPDVPPHAHRFAEERIGISKSFEFASAHCHVKLPVFQIFPVCYRNSLQRTQTADMNIKLSSDLFKHVTLK